MKKEEISYKIKELIAQKMSSMAVQQLRDSKGASISREDKLEDDLGIDSLAKIETVMGIERDLKINIDIDVYKKILTVGDLEDAVMAKLA